MGRLRAFCREGLRDLQIRAYFFCRDSFEELHIRALVKVKWVLGTKMNMGSYVGFGRTGHDGSNIGKCHA